MQSSLTKTTTIQHKTNPHPPTLPAKILISTFTKKNRFECLSLLSSSNLPRSKNKEKRKYVVRYRLIIQDIIYNNNNLQIRIIKLH